MLTKCIDGVPLFVDSSGDEWLLHHLIPDETPLSAGALELLNAESQIGVTLEPARLLDTETKSLLKWMSNEPPCNRLPVLIRHLAQSYAPAQAISLSVIAREPARASRRERACQAV